MNRWTNWKHRTPKYIWNRVRLWRYHKRYPNYPWITETANVILSTYVRPTDVGVEFGSGRSTLWIAKHVKHLTSVEHNKEWHDRISTSLKGNGVDNVTYYWKEKDMPQPLPIDWDEKGVDSAYARVLDEFDDNSLDFAFVDGIYRGPCALASIDKVRPGGFILIDNAYFWFPPPKKAFMPRSAPNGRTLEQGPASKQWTEFCARVEDWRYIYTSDGTQNTAFYFKPLPHEVMPHK